MYSYCVLSQGMLELTYNTPKQFNSRSCQSFGLAVLLGLSDNSGRWPISSNDELEYLEREIRNRVVKVMQSNSRRESIRTDWLSAVEELTFGEYTLQGWPNSVDERSPIPDFSDEVGLFHFLKSDNNLIKDQFSSTFMLSIGNFRGYLVSFKSIDFDFYSVGHVAIIIGIESSEEVNSNNSRPKLLILNSFDKLDYCSKGIGRQGVKSSGYVKWISDYEIKYHRVDYITRRIK